MVVEQLGREAVIAAQAVEEAGRLARMQQDLATAAHVKPDFTPTTVIDWAIQAIVAARLLRECPDDLLVAEESAAQLRRASNQSFWRDVAGLVRRLHPQASLSQVFDWIDLGGGGTEHRFWTLDPIDGTKGFLAGRQYAIALALIEAGVVQVAAIECPRLSPPADTDGTTETMSSGGTAIAVRGHGAWWKPNLTNELVRLKVSSCTEASAARLLRSYERAHGDSELLDRTAKALGTHVPPILLDSQAKHVTLAMGGGDLLIRIPPNTEFREAIWDHAAGSLVIEEAGGQVTDLTGRSLDFTTGRRLLRNDGVLASNRTLHRVALSAIRRARHQQ